MASPARASTTWTEASPTGTPPAPRYSAGQAYDATNDRLILFSGEDNLPLPRLTDVWVLVNATGSGGTPSWMELFPTGGPPLGRVFGTVVYAPGNNRIIVFGGCSANCSPNLSDVWVLANANGLGGTPAWTELFPSNPFDRSHHAATYDAANNRMIVFGGNLAFPNTDQNDVRVLTNADGTGGAPAWITLAPAGSLPPIREQAAVAYDQANNRMIMFGGGLNAGGMFQEKNDVWVLTNANGLGGTPAWTELAPSGSPPPARAFPSADYDPVTNRLIVFGGSKDNPNGYFNDVWVLTNANGLGGTPEWIQMSPGGSLPPERTVHSSGYSSSSNALVIAMGGNQTAPLLNDVWVLTDATGIPRLTALSPAKVWIGLKNSDSVGLRVDLKAEVYVDNTLAASGQDGAPGQPASTGSSGFNNALLRTIPLALADGAVPLPPGTELAIEVSVRRTCFGAGHNSGTVRLWYNGPAIDSGPTRNAGSRFDATIDGGTTDLFLRSGFVLSETAGTSRLPLDVAVNSAVACPGRPFVPFQSWIMTLP